MSSDPFSLPFPFSSMLDTASSDLAAATGSSTSIPPSATDLAAVTVAAASSEANTRPPSSVGVDVTATAVTTAADVADGARYDPAANIDGGPSRSSALGDDTDDGGGAGNTSVQVAVVSVISIAAKSSLRAYFEGVNWPLNKAPSKGVEFLNGPLGGIMRQFLLVKTQVESMPFLSYTTLLDGCYSACRRHPRLLRTTGRYFLGFWQGIPLMNVWPRA